MMKRGTVISYLKKIKRIFNSRDTAFELCGRKHFSPEISNFYYIGKYTQQKRTNKILYCDSNYIVNVAMGPNFGNSSISY